MASFDFDAARLERQRKVKPLTFKLGGKSFRCRTVFGLGDIVADLPVVPERVLAAATTEVGKHLVELTQRIATYLEPSELEKWWSLWDPDDTTKVQGADLVAVATWLGEQYGLPPASPRPVSSNGRARGGSTTSSRRGAKGSGR